MKSLVVSLAAAAAIVIAVPVLAQQKAAEKKAVIPSKTFFKGQQANQYLARDRLIGAKVVNKDGQIIGDIEDLIVTSDHKIEGVIMGVGGFLGAGEKKVGVRLAALKFESKDGKTVISLPQATKDVLAALEPYKRAEPRKSLVERATEKAKELTDKTKESVKGAYDKAKSTPPAEKKQ
jgi:sporulation protein YlmC with PRC-barrel domain